MDMRPLCSEQEWPRFESCIRDSIEEFTSRRLQPSEGSSTQSSDSPGNQTSSFVMVRRRTPRTRLLQNAQHDPARVHARAFASSQRLANFGFENETLHQRQPNRVQHSDRGNETIDSACYMPFDTMNVSSHTPADFQVDEIIDECADSEPVLWLDAGFQPSDAMLGLSSDYLSNPLSSPEQPVIREFDLGGVESSQHRQNRY
jgi:hypothetical protein